jgi:ABC-type lipoprotein export system ATPase subunit
VVMEALRDIQRTMNTTVILVTHDTDVASQMNRLITLVDGQIAADDPRSTATQQAIHYLQEKRATGELKSVRVDH